MIEVKTSPKQPNPFESTSQSMPLHDRYSTIFRWRLVPSILLIIVGTLLCAATTLHCLDVFFGALLAAKLTNRDIVKLSIAYFLCGLSGMCLIAAGYSTYTGKFRRAGTLCLGLGPLLGSAYMAIVML